MQRQSRKMRVLGAAAVSAMGMSCVADPAANAATAGAQKCITRSDGVECAVINSNSVESWHTEYSRSLSNDTGTSVPFTCSENSSSTFSSAYSAGLKGEFKAWVFAKVEVSVGVELTWTWSASGTSTVGPVSVPNGWKYTCKFGTATYSVEGHTTKYWSNGSVTKTSWSFMAPEDEKGWIWKKVRLS